MLSFIVNYLQMYKLGKLFFNFIGFFKIYLEPVLTFERKDYV